MAGRKKGSKNLKYSGEAIINEHGVAFTEEEQKRLTYLVNSANRKRKRMLEEEGELPYFIAGHDTGYKRKDIKFGHMGQEVDFVLAKKSKSLGRFKSKDQYERYVENLQRVTNRNYIGDRTEEYRANHIEGLTRVFGQEAEGVIDFIKSLKPKEYMQMVQSDETLDISYIDSELNGAEFMQMYGYSRSQQLERIENAVSRVKKDKIKNPKQRKQNKANKARKKRK